MIMELVLAAGLMAAPDYFGPEMGAARYQCPPASPAMMGWAGDQPLLSDVYRDWYVRILSAAAEPSLYARAAMAPDAYRFLWLPTFHEPVVVRLEEAGAGTMRLTAKRLSGPAGFRAGGMVATAESTVTAHEAARLRVLLTAAMAGPARDCGVAADGSQWVVEANVGGRYRLVHQGNPRTGPIREVGNALIALTGWTFQDVY
jgi:hypothetical protein